MSRLQGKILIFKHTEFKFYMAGRTASQKYHPEIVGTVNVPLGVIRKGVIVRILRANEPSVARKKTIQRNP